MERTISSSDSVLNLTVSDTLAVKPDIAVLSISIKNKDDSDFSKSNEDGVKEGTRKLSKIQSIIKNNIPDADVTTSRLWVEPVNRTVSIKKEHEGIFTAKESEVSYESKLVGYRHSAHITVETPADSENLLNLYCELSSDEDVGDVNIRFNVKDVESANNELIQLIANKAISKAKFIAEANGMQVNKILEINTDSNTSHGYYKSNMRAMNMLDEISNNFTEMEKENISEMFESMLNTPEKFSLTMTYTFLLCNI